MEEFRDIPGYEGFYQVSNRGNVISLVRLSAEAIASGQRRSKCPIRPWKSGRGRLKVTLCKDGKAATYQIYTLVQWAFVGVMENDEAANAHAKTKLTAAEVKLIRASNGTHRDLAALFGVSNVTIHCIRQRKTWKHVE